MSVSIATLTSQQASLQSQIKQLQAQISSVNAQISQLQTAIASLKSQLNSWINKVALLQTKVNTLTNAQPTQYSTTAPSQQISYTTGVGTTGVTSTRVGSTNNGDTVYSSNQGNGTTTTVALNSSGYITGYETTSTASAPTTAPKTLTFSEWNTLTNGGTTSLPAGYGNAILTNG